MATSPGTSEAAPETLLFFKALEEASSQETEAVAASFTEQSLKVSWNSFENTWRGGSHLVPHSMELRTGQASSMPSPSDTRGQGVLVGNANTLGSTTQNDTVDKNSQRCSLHVN